MRLFTSETMVQRSFLSGKRTPPTPAGLRVHSLQAAQIFDDVFIGGVAGKALKGARAGEKSDRPPERPAGPAAVKVTLSEYFDGGSPPKVSEPTRPGTRQAEEPWQPHTDDLGPVGVKNYTDIANLAQVHLEDSYVLALNERPDAVSFTLDLVLTPGHPRYHAPPPDEQYCYADAVLTIGNATEIDWIARSGRTYRDAAGEEDLGNIDSLQYRDGYFDITGDWGHVRVHTEAAPQLTFSPETSDAT
ncbi:hypothetical protein QRX50_05815 [Amycolatopsis carbonis]|uniref:Uncharacterized protein n=1 Tax=Amycolatopsis carbonis TaxID=715471 RepID=A0A9Y2IIZ4_9PSEU|nr:hypothetical protein [Amycolatopsis sp. 2-15]WIX80299.1 hypothetical protein QRX50_05815 [Amycolatopsis sp. 2-15]